MLTSGHLGLIGPSLTPPCTAELQVTTTADEHDDICDAYYSLRNAASGAVSEPTIISDTAPTQPP